MLLYHYAGQADAAAIAARGYDVARPGELRALAAPTAMQASA